MSNLAHKYDPEEEESFNRDLEERAARKERLRLIQGGDEAGDTDLDDDYSPADDDTPDNVVSLDEHRQKKADSASDLKKQESASQDQTAGSAADEDSDSLYNDKEESRLRRAAQKIKANRKKALIGGGVVAGVGGIGVGLFMALMPLKVVHVFQNLQKEYFASSESAVSSRLEHHFNRYVVKHIIPSLSGGNCMSTRNIDRNCYVPIVEKGLVGNLYNAWRDQRLESKMFDKFGFEVSRRAGSNTYVLSVDGRSSDIDIDGFLRNPQSGLFQASGNRDDIRRAVREALANETRWKQAMYRWKIGGLLERKYGIRRCAFFCKTRDNFADWNTNKRNAFKALVARRVIEPRSEVLGMALACVFSTDCDNDTASTDDNDANDLEKKDKLQRNVQKYLSERGAEYSKDTIQKITSVVADITESGSVTRFIIKSVITKVTNETIAKAASSSLPIVGWVDIVAQTINKVKNFGPKFKKWAYTVNSAIMVSQMALYFSHANEIKNGKVDFEMMGSVADSLNGMEKSPLYQNIMTTPDQAVAGNIFMPKVFAAEPDSSPYLCNDGKPVPSGRQVCDEERLVFDNALTRISDMFKEPPLEQLGQIAEAWTNTAGWLLRKPGELIGWALDPLLGPLNDRIAELAEPLMERMAKIIPNPLGDDPSGGKNFNVAAGGANVSGNEAAHYMTGGKQISNAQAMAIRKAMRDEEHQNFQNQSLYARLFDTESRFSLVSRVAIAIPSDTGAYTYNAAASLLNAPLNAWKMLGSMFRSPVALAAAGEDPFGITQYGIPLGDPALTAERPEDCDAYNKAWAESSTTDPETGLEVHDTVNICLLDDAAIGSGGAMFDTSVLKPEDLGETSSGASQPGTNPDTSVPGLPSGDAAALAKQLLDSPNVNIDKRDQMQNLANGKGPCPNVNASYTFDTQLLRILVALAQDNTFTISSLHRGCTGSTAGAGTRSRHWRGKAVDISGSRPINGVTMAGSFSHYDQTGAIQRFVNQAKALLPAGCELGVPNNTYKNAALAVNSPCTMVFLDTKSTTGATSPHVHLGVP